MSEGLTGVQGLALNEFLWFSRFQKTLMEPNLKRIIMHFQRGTDIEALPSADSLELQDFRRQ